MASDISKLIKALKDTFPYCDIEDENSRYFNSALVGISDSQNVLIRINHAINDYTFGVVDDEYKQFLYSNINSLKDKVSQILKSRMIVEQTNSINKTKAELNSMILCGFISQIGLTYSIDKNSDRVIIKIFGTIFDVLIIVIYASDPEVYVISQPRAKLNIDKVKQFINMCKELK